MNESIEWILVPTDGDFHTESSWANCYHFHSTKWNVTGYEDTAIISISSLDCGVLLLIWDIFGKNIGIFSSRQCLAGIFISATLSIQRSELIVSICVEIQLGFLERRTVNSPEFQALDDNTSCSVIVIVKKISSFRVGSFFGFGSIHRANTSWKKNSNDQMIEDLLDPHYANCICLVAFWWFCFRAASPHSELPLSQRKSFWEIEIWSRGVIR